MSEREGERGPEFHVENIGGGVAINSSFLMLTGGEVLQGNAGEKGYLRPGEGGQIRAVLRHAWAERAAILACVDGLGVIHVWTRDRRYQRIRRRWGPMFWRPADQGLSDLFERLNPGTMLDEASPAPWAWVPEGSELPSEMEIMGFGKP